MEFTTTSLQNLSVRSRLGWSVCSAVLVFLLLPSSWQLQIRVLAMWSAGASCYLALLMGMMRKATAAQTRLYSQRQRTGSLAIWSLVITAIAISALAFDLMLSATKGSNPLYLSLRIGLAILAIFSAWFLLHITFAQQYATLYYRSAPSSEKLESDPLAPQEINREDDYAGGLRFVEETSPTYWEFLYFAFVIAATAQTADTFIASRPMRRLALGQGLAAFWFFVGIIGMTVNLASALLNAGQKAG